jgi:hypothetical protein
MVCFVYVSDYKRGKSRGVTPKKKPRILGIDALLIGIRGENTDSRGLIERERANSQDNGEWRMENGEWRMENGEWKVGNGGYVFNGRYASSPIIHSPFSIIH